MGANGGLLRYPGDVTGGDRARVGAILGHTDPPDVIYWEVTDATAVGVHTEIGLQPAGRESQLREVLDYTRQADCYERLMRAGLIRTSEQEYARRRVLASAEIIRKGREL